MSVLVAFRDNDGGGLTWGGRPEAKARRLVMPLFLGGIFHDALDMRYVDIKGSSSAANPGCVSGWRAWSQRDQ